MLSFCSKEPGTSPVGEKKTIRDIMFHSGLYETMIRTHKIVLSQVTLFIFLHIF